MHLTVHAKIIVMPIGACIHVCSACTTIHLTPSPIIVAMSEYYNCSIDRIEW